jgi:hypothetical protein
MSGWIHGLKAVTSQLGWAWHEVATMDRLFPSLPGMAEYKQTLRRMTKTSNDLLLQVVEDLSYKHSDNRKTAWDALLIEGHRERILEELIAERDAFVYGNERILLGALGLEPDVTSAMRVSA